MTISTGYHSPGVYVAERLQTLPLPSQFLSPSTACFAGEHHRGPLVPVLCTSWGQFLTFFGGFNPYISAQLPFTTPATQKNPYLPFAVYEFFANGGQQCWAYRILNSAGSGGVGSSASVTIADTSATPQVQYMTFTAGAFGLKDNYGAWGNAISLQITGTASQATPQASADFGMQVFYQGALVEQWPDLSANPSSPRYFLTMINSAVAGSSWIFAAHLAPTDVTQPPFGTYALAGGVDPGGSWTGGTHQAPSATDRIAVLTTSPQTPGPLDGIPGMININLPGESFQQVLQAGAAYCDSTGAPGSFRPYSFFVADTGQGQTVGQVVAAGTLGRGSAAMYYPWVQASDPSSPNPSTTVWLPPGGFVLGQYAAMDAAQGPWYAPAGLQTALANVVGAESSLSPAAIGTLTDHLINGLRTLANGSVVIWGARTQLATYPSKYVPIRRMLNYIESSLAQMLDFAVFQPNDQMLWSNISHVCLNFLGSIYAKNGFPGPTVAASYFVTCDSTNNTPQTVQNGVVNTTVGVALEFPAEFIQLNIVQFQNTGQISVTIGGPA